MIDLTIERARDYMRGHPRVEGIEVKQGPSGPYLLLTFHPNITQAEEDAAEAAAEAFPFGEDLDRQWAHEQLGRRAREQFDKDDPGPRLLRAAVIEMLIEMMRIRQGTQPRSVNAIFDAIKERAGV